MAKFLADENMPSKVVAALRASGYDVAWVSELMPGADDRAVLRVSHDEQRVLLTLDKDFGEIAFRFGQTASCGIILLRPRLKSPDHVARLAVTLLAQSVDWENHFSVAQEGHVRVVQLPP